jgi:hypothetical protein
MSLSYIKTNIIECALLSILSCALVITEFTGFNATADVTPSIPLASLLIVAVLVLCYIFSTSRKMVVIGAISFFVVIGLGVAIANNLVDGNIFSDTQGNSGIFLMIVLFTSLAIFLCSRFRLGSIIIFGVGTFIFAATEFLYTPHLYIAFFIYLITSATFIALKYYKFNDDGAKFRGVITTVTSALIFCLVVALLSTGIYFGIIKPNEPTPRELKLITVKMALPVIMKTGIAESFEQEDKNKLTSENDDIEDASKDKTQDENKTKKDIKNNQNQDKESSDVSIPSFLDMTKNGLFAVYNFLKDNAYLLLVLLVLVVGFIFASIYLKLYTRRKWIKDVKASDNATQTKLIFLFILKRIRKVKKKIGRGETLLEFGERMNEELPLFNTSGVTFAELCDTYSNLIYGGKMPEDTACQNFLSYYNEFYRNLKTQVGRWKYAKIFFFV